MKTEFIKLNIGWNAEPNVPHVRIEPNGSDLVVSFDMNPFQFPQFKEDDIGRLTFKNCWR